MFGVSNLIGVWVESPFGPGPLQNGPSSVFMTEVGQTTHYLRDIAWSHALSAKPVTSGKEASR